MKSEFAEGIGLGVICMTVFSVVSIVIYSHCSYLRLKEWRNFAESSTEALRRWDYCAGDAIRGQNSEARGVEVKDLCQVAAAESRTLRARYERMTKDGEK